MIGGRGAYTPGSPLNVPPVLASNFVLGSDRAYTRDDAMPTWEAFEDVLGSLEHGVAVAFASGRLVSMDLCAFGALVDLFLEMPWAALRNLVPVPKTCPQTVRSLANASWVRWRGG